ncbi:LOW QUALITY PROTEIN: hypothetical protein M8C21_022836, partial [Ambrosia artemisiifolia]
KEMDSLPNLTVLEQSEVSPPPAAIGRRSLLLTFLDIVWLAHSEPAHSLFFYELQLITRTQFTQTIIPNLKQSLSLTVTFAECNNLDYPKFIMLKCNNLDFNDLIGNHPRECDKFYPLIPLLGRTTKVSDYITIPVFAVQVTLFPNHGISIGMTNQHSLGDANAMFCFLKAWTSIAQSGGVDELFLTNGTLPIFDRLVETYNEEYKLPRLSGPTDKVRATFILSRITISGLKKLVSTQLPTLAYISSFTVACAYIWNCLAIFVFAVDCRSRTDPPIPEAYFGNCLMPCLNVARAFVLTGKEGFLAAAELIGENLNKMLTDKEGVLKEKEPMENLFVDGPPTRITGDTCLSLISTNTIHALHYTNTKPTYYTFTTCPLIFPFVMMDGPTTFANQCSKLNNKNMHSMGRREWRPPWRAVETAPNAVGKVEWRPPWQPTSRFDEATPNAFVRLEWRPEASEDLEIGVCLSATEMDVFVGSFKSGLELALTLFEGGCMITIEKRAHWEIGRVLVRLDLIEGYGAPGNPNGVGILIFDGGVLLCVATQKEMDPLSNLTVLEQSEVLPPPAAIGCRSLLLTFLDIVWLAHPEPTHTLFFYELPMITRTHFTQTIVPSLKQTLSLTLQHFFPFAVFAVQVTLFPNCGISIGITNHHSLCDTSTMFCFLKAWTSIAQSSGSNESFLANGTLPIFDRLLKYPKRDESCLKNVKVEETYNEEYKLPRLSGPTDKVRATFTLTRTTINRLKKLVSTQEKKAAAELIGKNLNKMLTDKEGVLKENGPMENLFVDGPPTRITGVSGTPKFKFYDLDF